MYVNYHKHTSYSNIWGNNKDSVLLPISYWDEMKKRYGNQPCVYTTVEHGYQSPYFKIYDKLEAYNKKNGTNIKFVFGAEVYWVKDRFEKDKANCHMVILARNENGRRAINRILSEANKTGYYYRPRIDLELIFSLPKEDVFITTACIAYHKYEDIEEITVKLNEYFKYFYLEIQAHNTDKNIELNKKILEWHKKYNIPLIAGCDTHYLTEEESWKRDYLIKSARKTDVAYEDEAGWYMDYPTKETLFNRFKELNIFSDKEIEDAIEITNTILDFEDIVLDRSIKVPIVKFLQNKTQEERNEYFIKLLRKEWKAQYWDINKDKIDEYIAEIKNDINEILKCNMADYFITSYYIMKRGREKYGGTLTKTGRGSAPSMFINKLLNLTNIDRINSSVTMYPERFITASRVIESHTPPDIDSNVVSREPFIQAQKDLIGEKGTYDLVAFGKLKLKSAWKMYARAEEIDPEVANDISKQLDKYQEALKYADDGDDVKLEDYISVKYLDMIENAKDYFDVIDTAKGHACACCATNLNLEEEIGLLLCVSESTGNKVLTTLIESDTIDAFGWLKQDYLIVKSISLIFDTYKEIGIEPLTINQLLDKIKDDDKTWEIYEKGYTMGVNQVEKPKSTEKVMRFKPKNISELCQFVAGIRPSFKTMYKTFENREHFEYGIKTFDNLIQNEFCSSSFILYQEDLMKVLSFAKFPIGDTYTIIKAISKKKKEVIDSAKEKFVPNFAQAILDTKETNDREEATDMAERVWTIIENSASYGFNCLSGDTKLFRENNGGFSPTIEEMYNIRNNVEYAKRTNHSELRSKYINQGYGKCFSLGVDGRVYKNNIIDIYKQPKAMTYLITTESGKTIKATSNHKFPIYGQANPKIVSELKIGDMLYIKGKYEKNNKTYNLTNGNFENNFPKKGERGFQTNKNGSSVIYKKFRKEKIENKCCCFDCNKQYSKDERFEVHHIDFNRENNCFENYVWLCASCHKKRHFQNGRHIKGQKGYPTYTEKIISIEENDFEDVYDVSVSGDVSHTFAIDNGIITSNCSHSYSMALDSVNIAYLKAHYPLEFYKTALNLYSEKKDKDKISAFKHEAILRGIKIKPICFGDDNRKFNIDKENNTITETVSGIKDIQGIAGEVLYEMSKIPLKTKIDLFEALYNSELNIKTIKILTALNYFKPFGTQNEIEIGYDIFKKFRTSKILTKSKLTEIELKSIKAIDFKETKSQFRDFNNLEFIENVIKNTDIPPTTFRDRVRNQILYLGYCDVKRESLSSNIYAVLDTETDNYGRIWATLYQLNSKDVKTVKVDKEYWKEHSFEKGDVIRCGFRENEKRRKENGQWYRTGEYEEILNVFSKM